MQGKNIFTSIEAEVIKNLLRQKPRASKSEQKKIRGKMRDLKFYITDFDRSQAGFTVIDFENLIKTKRIIITNEGIQNSINRIEEKTAENEGDRINFNSIRNNNKPNTVKVLYIGESPPNRGTFFYGANSNLFRCIRKAFAKVIGETVGDGFNFLKYFKDNNFYLDDLCLDPVNNKTDSEKIILRQQGIEPLSKRINVFSPQAIIILMKGIESEVRESIKRSDLAVSHIFVTTFPSFNQANKDNCVNDNEFVLRKLLELNIIKKENGN